MIEDGGQGTSDLHVRFRNPILVSQRYDEGLITIHNFTHPKKAMEDGYPEGAFGYSPILPMDMNFHKPVQFHSVYLKKHRSSDFYRKNSVGTFEVLAYLNNRLVLNATLMASSNQWKHYSPHESLIVDRLVLAPGLDIDNLLTGVDIRSEESLIDIQNKRKHHQNFLIERAYTLKKWGTSGFEHKTHSKKGTGVTLVATPQSAIAETSSTEAGTPAAHTLDAYRKGLIEL